MTPLEIALVLSPVAIPFATYFVLDVWRDIRALRRSGDA